MIVLSCFVYVSARAQCETCGTIPDKTVDHCYVETGQTGRCAMFILDSRTFYYEDQNRKKGKLMELPLPPDGARPDNTWLTSLTLMKKLKLKTSSNLSNINR